MITRKDIQSLYSVDAKGVIRSPGKFQGSPIYAPYFHNAILLGDGEEYGATEESAGTHFFRVTPEDVEAFPELDGIAAVTCWEDSNGFAYTAILQTGVEVARFQKQFVEKPESLGEH